MLLSENAEPQSETVPEISPSKVAKPEITRGALKVRCQGQDCSCALKFILCSTGVPAIVTGVSAGSLGDKYTRQGQICWLDLSESASYATTVPVCLCVLLQLFFLAAVFFCPRPQRNLSARLFQRARCVHPL
ncbi:hypothetical protein V5799_004250 [Amblyomma americanum]|uniref:Uncharacterized protein n=1 Tax=Amblyomma americanum TaxID=6943 RepID=A0AAQ4D6M8_AMBAM